MAMNEQAAKLARTHEGVGASAKAPAKAQEKTYTIGDLSKEFDVTLRTLRFYEHRGLVKPRRVGLARLYTEQDKARLALILKGKHLGFTLTEIRAMLAANDRDGEEPTDLSLSREQITTQISHLESQRETIDAAIAELKQKHAMIASKNGGR